MSQATDLHQALKRALKQHGLTYGDVASALQLSEASIKRLFAEQSFSLQRLEQVCQLMGMDLTDLVLQMNQQQSQIDCLTEIQEQEIVADTALLLVTVCVLNHWRLEDIVERYRLTELECIRKLAQLDRLGLIELLPGNRIRLRIAPNFSWRENGPIQAFFLDKIQHDFFAAGFRQADEQLLVLNGMLSPASQQELQSKLSRLQREFDDMNRADRHLPVGKRLGVTVVMATRSWRYGVFAPLRRDAEE